MKRLLIVFGVVIFCLLACGPSIAQIIGNPADINLPPGRGVLSADMGDFIVLTGSFDAEFLVEKEFKNANEGSTDQKIKGQYFAGRLSCILFDRIQPYITLGVSELEMKWNDGITAVKLETGTAPVWGAGLKAYLWEFEGLGLKIFSAASFRTVKPDRIRLLSVGGALGNVTEKRLRILEKQVALGVSREFIIPGYENVSIVPYIGGVWSETTANIRVTQGANTVNFGAKGQKDNLGLFFGMDFIFMDNLSLNAEARIIDEKTLSLGFTTLF